MWVSLRSFLLGALVGAGTVVATSATADRGSAPGSDVDGLYRGIEAIFQRYVDPVDRGRLMAVALKHMAAGLDTHSYFLTAAERRALANRDQGADAGIDLALRESAQGRRFEVIAVHDLATAVQPGDRVIAINGVSTASLLTLVEAQALLRGAQGDHVRLRVRRAGHDHEVTLQMKKARQRDVEGHLWSDSQRSIAVVCIHAFRRGTGARVRKQLRELRRRAGRQHALSGVVLDLRGNPGGEVDEALIVADTFVAGGILTRTRGRGGVILREELAHARDTDDQTPVVILQDRHTASAAELLAAALKDHGRARVVGERSYGKGTVQEVLGFRDGSRLTFTVARYFSPNDRTIDGIGIEPDHALPVELLQSRSRQQAVTAAIGQLPPKPDSNGT